MTTFPAAPRAAFLLSLAAGAAAFVLSTGAAGAAETQYPLTLENCGRKVTFDRGDKMVLWIMMAAFVMRIVAPQIFPSAYLRWLEISAAGWLAARACSCAVRSSSRARRA